MSALGPGNGDEGLLPGARADRAEVSTYLTYPEWYIVYSAREQAAWLETRRPSGFPYLSSIGQYWCGYDAVASLAGQRYAFNADDHVMLLVIGVSFTAEYGLKAAYEGTVGRATEQLDPGPTEEDRFAGRLAAGYAAFLDLTPWYDFPYGARLAELWSTPSRGGLRAWERRLALTAELAAKTAYSGAIGALTHAAYGEQDPTTPLWAERASDATLSRLPGVRAIGPVDPDSLLLELPRYADFQAPFLGLVRAGVRPRAIAGNRRLMLTVLAPAEWSFDLPYGQPLFEQAILTDPGRKRVAIGAPVASVGPLILALDERGLPIEHVYDY